MFMMRILHKFVAAMMAVSLLLISTVPVAPAATCDLSAMHSADMNRPRRETQVESASPLIDWHDCYIECSCRIDNHLDGMPHQLAPHALSLTGLNVGLTAMDVDINVVPGLIARHLFPPTPPPIII